jgi:hypothetical protein
VSILNSIGVINIICETESCGRFYLCTKNEKKLCETRRVERVEALADFYSSFEAIIDVLDEISEWEDTNASSKANKLTSSLTNFEFLISSHYQVSVLDLFLPLSKLFQKSSLDVGYARNVINNLIETLKYIRTNCDSTIFENAEKISKLLNITVGIPNQTPSK